MNLFELDATGLLLWGLVAHRIADFALQNAWMARNKAARRHRGTYRVVDELDVSSVDAIRDVGDPRPGMVRAHVAARVVKSHDEPRPTRWWDRHPAAYAHAAVHGMLLAPILGWPALLLSLVHLVVDTRTPVAWWSRLVRQDQPEQDRVVPARSQADESLFEQAARYLDMSPHEQQLVRDELTSPAPNFGIGTWLRLELDQTFHFATLAVAALVVGGLA